ncbi:uncharacterized protein LOC117640948 isoform X3 [Thrips palmi]|uniref:Uncharacterized protein LOC117640948 isoform X3 n=1 Tax=Thrips palmi TaxID=161013 RepID=A0A6P8ZIM9_THRPL|nr:uncharacterized protein LOC117640948 isoform X3 [Thrips palmi]
MRPAVGFSTPPPTSSAGGLRARRPPSTCRRFAVVRPKSKPRGIACVRSAGAACAACSACSDDDGFAFAAFALVSRWQPIQRRKGRDQGSSGARRKRACRPELRRACCPFPETLNCDVNI